LRLRLLQRLFFSTVSLEDVQNPYRLLRLLRRIVAHLSTVYELLRRWQGRLADGYLDRLIPDVEPDDGKYSYPYRMEVREPAQAEDGWYFQREIEGEWQYDYMGSGAGVTLRRGKVTVFSGSTSHAVTFDPPFSTPDVAVTCTPSWRTDVWVTDVSGEGFTANFGTSPTMDGELSFIAYEL